MESIILEEIIRQYKNNGQHAEQVFRFTVEHKICKADNRSAELGGDCGDIQIKSARASVCKGTDIVEYLKHDGAKRYAYVTSDFKKAYVMNKEEYIKFVNEFSTVTKDSEKNGGALKRRLCTETKKMIQWFANA